MRCFVSCGRTMSKLSMAVRKTRCICDGSTRSGKVRILAETYANCVDQTSARMFYAIAAAENLLVYGADVSNAFAEAPPTETGFLHPPHSCIQRMVGSTQKLTPHSSRSCHPYPLCYAGTPRITTPLGETCRRNSLRNWTYSNGTRTLSILRYDQ